MERNEFIKTLGVGCLCGALVPLLESCTGTKILSRNITGSDLIIPLTDFETSKDNQKSYRKYIIVHNEQLKSPICIYRFSEEEYTALWMNCTHQGAELQVFGDKLQCPAHGSEFSNRGDVQQGPADQALRAFQVNKENNQLKISLQ